MALAELNDDRLGVRARQAFERALVVTGPVGRVDVGQRQRLPAHRAPSLTEGRFRRVEAAGARHDADLSITPR